MLLPLWYFCSFKGRDDRWWIDKSLYAKVEIFFKDCGKSFHDFPTMSRAIYNEQQVGNSNRLILDELHYKMCSLLVEQQ